jgi:hypothetical protein
VTPDDFRNPDWVRGWLHGILLGVAIMVVASLADAYFGNPPCPASPPSQAAPVLP